MTIIHCVRCGKEIVKKCNRDLCIKCRNNLDRELATLRRQNHREEIREKDRDWYNKNRKKYWPRNVLYV